MVHTSPVTIGYFQPSKNDVKYFNQVLFSLLPFLKVHGKIKLQLSKINDHKESEGSTKQYWKYLDQVYMADMKTLGHKTMLSTFNFSLLATKLAWLLLTVSRGLGIPCILHIFFLIPAVSHVFCFLHLWHK